MPAMTMRAERAAPCTSASTRTSSVVRPAMLVSGRSSAAVERASVRATATPAKAVEAKKGAAAPVKAKVDENDLSARYVRQRVDRSHDEWAMWQKKVDVVGLLTRRASFILPSSRQALHCSRVLPHGDGN